MTNSSCAWHEYVCLLRCFHYFCQLAHADTTLVLSNPVAEDTSSAPSSVSAAVTLALQAGSYLLKPKAVTNYDALDISADMDDNKEPPLGKDGKPLPAMVEVLSMAPPWAKYPDYEKVRSWGHCRPSSFDLGMENEGGSTALVWLSGGVSGRLLLSKPLAELHPIASSLQRWQSAGKKQSAAEHGRKGKGSWRAWTNRQTALWLSHAVHILLCTRRGKTASIALAFCQQCLTSRKPLCAADSVAEQRCDTHAVQKGLAGCCQRLGPLPHMLGT